MSHRRWCCDISCDRELDHNYLNEDRVNYSGNLKFFLFEWSSAEYVVMFCRFDVTLEIAMEISWQHLLSFGSRVWAVQWGNRGGTSVGEIMGSFHVISAGKSYLQYTLVMFISLLKIGETTTCHWPFSAGCIVVVRVSVYTKTGRHSFLLWTRRRQCRFSFRLDLFLEEFPFFHTCLVGCLLASGYAVCMYIYALLSPLIMGS